MSPRYFDKEQFMSLMLKQMPLALFFCCLIFLANNGQKDIVLAMDHGHGETHHGHEDTHQVQSEFDFLVEMIPHHQEAVDSSRKIMAITERPQLQSLAVEIIEAQEAEIQQMREWLTLLYPDRHAHIRYQPMMRDPEGMSVQEAEKAFLEDMIHHHEMAVMMAEQLLKDDLAGNPEVKEMAGLVIESQNEEIELMKKWLQNWF
jgi:uncharacterized protein (DUF305 family)